MKRKGFTLVEILIVVIILGILAAIVIPQFTQASNDARMSSLVSDLQTMRGQVELYKIQHGHKLPTNLVTQMTSITDFNGLVAGDAGVGVLKYGPYLQKFPTNPYNNLDTVASDAVGPLGNDSTGWHYHTTTAQFSANDTTTAGMGL